MRYGYDPLGEFPPPNPNPNPRARLIALAIMLIPGSLIHSVKFLISSLIATGTLQYAVIALIVLFLSILLLTLAINAPRAYGRVTGAIGLASASIALASYIETQEVTRDSIFGLLSFAILMTQFWLFALKRNKK